MRLMPTTLALTLALWTGAGCSIETTASIEKRPGDVILAKAAHAIPASRANYVWADSVDVAPTGQPANWLPAGIRGDGRLKDGAAAVGALSNEYQGDYCGVAATLQEGERESGDLVFDPDNQYQLSMASACGDPRAYAFYLQGSGASPILAAPLSRGRGLAGLAVGQSQTQAEGFGVQLPNCNVLFFDDQYLPSSSPRQSRLLDTTVITSAANAVSARRWRIESQGSHIAVCVVPGKRAGTYMPTGVTYLLPFALTVTEIPYPNPTFP